MSIFNYDLSFLDGAGVFNCHFYGLDFTFLGLGFNGCVSLFVVFVMIILAIESSCDETAVAVLRGDVGAVGTVAAVEVLADFVASQIDIHKVYGGVVPELASREHTRQLKPLLELALEQAGITLQDVDVFAGTAGPGLSSSLLIGHSAAKMLAAVSGKVYYAMNHMEGHLLSPFLGTDESVSAALGLVVSGGHTMLVDIEEVGSYKILGQTVDDAAGEAFDKGARMLSLAYPGGPEIERLAALGDAEAYDFPRSMLHEKEEGKEHCFSFSGLKTSLFYALQKEEQKHDKWCREQVKSGLMLEDACPDFVLQPEVLQDICASFQQAIIDVLVRKTLAAALKYGRKVVAVSGGVACNATLVAELERELAKQGIELLTAERSMNTDNALMIAYAAWLRACSGQASDADDAGIYPRFSGF